MITWTLIFKLKFKVRQTQTVPSIGPQQYAIQNRINEPSFDTKSPQTPLKDIDLIQLLPDKKVQENLKNEMGIAGGESYLQILGKVQHLNQVAVHHISHAYSKDMASKSDLVSECYTILLINMIVSSDVLYMLTYYHGLMLTDILHYLLVKERSLHLNGELVKTIIEKYSKTLTIVLCFCFYFSAVLVSVSLTPMWQVRLHSCSK